MKSRILLNLALAALVAVLSRMLHKFARSSSRTLIDDAVEKPQKTTRDRAYFQKRNSVLGERNTAIQPRNLS